MAARLDRKFILIVSICTVVLLGVVGAALFILQPWGPARHIRRAEAAVAEGDWRRAFDFYGRAFGKDPGDLSLLELTRESLLKIEPATADEARERYQNLLAILDRRTRVGSPDPERWQEFLDAVLLRAVCVDERSGWAALAEQAGLMEDSFGSGDPAKALAEEYRLFAIAQREATLRSDEREELVDDLAALAATRSESDRVRGSQVRVQLAEAIRLEDNARRLEAAEVFAEVDEMLAAIAADEVDGLEVRLARAQLAAYRASRDPSEQAAIAADAALEAVADAAAKAGPADSLRGARALLVTGRPSAAPLAARVLEGHLEQNSDDLFHAQLLAFIYKFTDQDRSLEIATRLSETPRLRVGLASAFQSDIALGAAAQVFDTRFSEWGSAESDEARAAIVKQLEEAIKPVEERSQGLADDSLLLRCQAKLDLAKGNKSSSAQKFEEVLRRGQIRDLDTLYFASLALREVGESGRALQLLEEAQAMQPDNIMLMGVRGEISLRVGRNREATALAERILRIDPENEGAKRMLDAARQLEGIALGGAPDLATDRLKSAEAAFTAGAYGDAEQILASLRAERPQDSRIPRAQAQVALRQQRNEEALRFLEEALALDPRDPVALQMKSVLVSEDPIERIRMVAEQMHAGDPGLPGYLYSAFEAARREFQRKSESLIDSDPESAKRFSDLAIRAAEAAQETRPALDNADGVPALIAARFDDAMSVEKFDEALAIAAEADQTGDLSLRPMLEARVQGQRGDYKAALATLDQAIAAGIGGSRMLRERGVLLEMLGRPAEALDAYESAIARRPNDLESIRRRAALLIRSGRPAEALELMRTARRLAPQDRGLEETWLNIEGEFGDRRLALTRRGERYVMDANDSVNSLALAGLLVEANPGREDVIDRQGRIRFGVGQWDSLTPKERQTELETITNKWRNQAIAIFEQLVAGDPESLDFARAYASGLRRIGRGADGEAALRNHIAVRGESAGPLAWLALGAYLVESQKGKEALEAFEEAVRVQNPSVRGADLALSDFWFRRNDWGRAIIHLDSVVEASPNRDVQLRRIECLIKLDRLDDAATALAAIGDRDLTSVLLEGSIADLRGQQALKNGEAAAAADHYQRFDRLAAEARELAPASPLPLVQQSASFSARHRLSGDPAMADGALQAVDAALRLEPSSWSAMRLRTDLLITQGNLSAAAAGLEEYVQRQPDFDEARRLLIDTQIESANIDRAQAVAAEAVSRNPNDAAWHQTYAELALRRRQFGPALASFRRAYELAPTAPTLHRVVDMYLRQQPPDFEGVLEMVALAPDDVDRSVYLQSAEAVALFGNGQNDLGLERLRESYRFAKKVIAEGDSGSSLLDGWFANLRFVFPPAEAAQAEAFVREAAEGQALHPVELRWLAELNGALGEAGRDRAGSLLEEAMAADDGSDPATTARLMLDVGNFRYTSGDCRGAVEAFERSASLGRPNPQTLNNLAFLCGDCLDDPTRGIPYIEQAIALSGNVAEYLDTYGYLLWRAARLDEAEETLLRSLRIRESALANYHLAEVLAARGNTAQARTAIQRSKSLNPSPDLQTSLADLESRLQ